MVKSVRVFVIVCILSLSQLQAPISEALVFSNNGQRSRRDALCFSASIFTSGLLVVAPPPASSSSSSSTSQPLLALIPAMKYEAPATNATIPKDLSRQIEALAESLEHQQSNNAQSSLLSGNWKLLYSNGPEITSLATNLPLGFQLGKTTQPIGNGVFENRGTLEHPFGLAHWQTNVVGDVRVAPSGSLNAVGVVNDRNNRIDVEFRVLVFVMDQVLGQKVNLVKTLIPKPLAPGQAQPANDITYLDEKVRIVRGGDGALFIFERDYEDVELLTADERRTLMPVGKKSKEVEVGIGAAEKSSSPELQFLFQQRKAPAKQ